MDNNKEIEEVLNEIREYQQQNEKIIDKIIEEAGVLKSMYLGIQMEPRYGKRKEMMFDMEFTIYELKKLTDILYNRFVHKK